MSMKIFINKLQCFGAILVFLVLSAALNKAFAAPYELEIIQPRAGLNTENRFYKAYPGIEYNVRLGVIGGAYPYTYSLTSAPEGMTIDEQTGEISWSGPIESNSPYAVTARVTDLESNATTVSWTVTVTTSGFRFVDSVNGNDNNAGSLSAPWATLDRVGDAAASDFIYFRSGTYSSSRHYDWDGNSKAMVWLSYPSETASFDLALGGFFVFNGSNRLYIDGLDFDLNSNSVQRAFSWPGHETNVTFRRNSFKGLLNGSPGNNPAYLFGGNSHEQGYYTVVQDNVCTDGVNAYFLLGYANSHVLVEDNDISGMSGNIAISPKDGNKMWFIRGNEIAVSGIGIALQGYDSKGFGKGDIVIEYNNIETTGGNNEHISLAGYAQQGPVTIERNTLQGRFYNYLNGSGAGTFTYSKNVIINDTDFGHTDRLRHPNGEHGQTIFDDNLVGGTSDNIVDAYGRLSSQYESRVGTHGWQIGATVSSGSLSKPPSSFSASVRQSN